MELEEEEELYEYIEEFYLTTDFPTMNNKYDKNWRNFTYNDIIEFAVQFTIHLNTFDNKKK